MPLFVARQQQGLPDVDFYGHSLLLAHDARSVLLLGLRNVVFSTLGFVLSYKAAKPPPQFIPSQQQTETKGKTMNFLENVPFTRLADLLEYTSKELKEQVANGEQKNEWTAINMVKNQAFIAALKKEIAKRLESI